MRGFPSDLTITATCHSVLEALEAALGDRPVPHLAERQSRLTRQSAALRETWSEEAKRAGNANTITLPWLNHCLRDIVDADTIVISEYSFRQEYCPLDTPGSLFALSSPGGLGGVSQHLSVRTGVAEQDGDVGTWGWRLHVRQSDRVSLRRANAKSAGFDSDL